MLKLIFFLCLLAYALAGASEEASHRLDGRIPGGSGTTITEYPYQISVQYSGSPLCGGSIISSEWVLTAAHCMVYSVAGYSVRAGTTYRGSGGTVYSATSAIKHPSYDSRTYDYDVALIRISGSFTYDTSVQPVDLAASPPAEGVMAVATGWGISGTGGTISTVLERVPVPIVSNAKCDYYYGGGLITDRMLCAGYEQGGRDVCGETGGPLAVDGVQVGIVSWGYGCGRPLYPGVYANVANLRSWIVSNADL